MLYSFLEVTQQLYEIHITLITPTFPATTSQLFLPHQLHHVVVHNMEGALKPPKTRSVHNNPHVRDEPPGDTSGHRPVPIVVVVSFFGENTKITALIWVASLSFVFRKVYPSQLIQAANFPTLDSTKQPDHHCRSLLKSPRVKSPGR